MRSRIVWKVAVPSLAVLLAGGGCAQNPRNPDPFEKCNRFFYKVNDGLDNIMLKTNSDVNTKVVPQPVRDVPRIPVGMYTNVLHYVDLPDTVSIPMDVLNVAEDRSRANAAIKFRDEAAIDPYIFMREAYLQFRRIKIYGADRASPTMEPG